jgi:hypothetical protein
MKDREGQAGRGGRRGSSGLVGQAAALQPRVDGSRRHLPHARLGVDEGLDLEPRQLESLRSDGGERFRWRGDELAAQILVGDDLPDQQLHGSLRHGGVLSQAACRKDRASQPAAPP